MNHMNLLPVALQKKLLVRRRLKQWGVVWGLCAAVALTVWVIAESVAERRWLGLLAIPATFGIGVSCGLPLYLFLRGLRGR